MKPFSKSEIMGVSIIFLVLVLVSIPNFIASLRRARDQVRKDDMGALQEALGEYFEDLRFYPQSNADGKIVACLKPGETAEIDKLGHVRANFIPCEWGGDGLVDPTPGSSKVYMKLLPREPDFQKGAAYRYISDGRHAQIFVSLEGKDEPEYDPKIIARGLMCGNLICNAGRAYGCATDKSLEQCSFEELQKSKK